MRRGDGRWSGVAGVHLFRADQDEFIDFPADSFFDDEIRTAALFGEGTVALRDDLDLTLGARYERETHRRVGGDAQVDEPRSTASIEHDIGGVDVAMDDARRVQVAERGKDVSGDAHCRVDVELSVRF